MIAALACLIVLAVLHLLTPFWWWVLAVPFLFGLSFGRSSGRSIRTGAAAAGALWLGAAVYEHLTGSALIAGRMATLMGIGSSWLMVVATGLVAALAAGIAAWAGYSLRAPFRKR